MRTLRELRAEGERHLKKAAELLGTADLLRNLTADAAKADALSPAFADEADAAAKELYDNYHQSQAFLDDVVRRLNTTDQTMIQTMNDRFDQLVKQRDAAIVRYNSLLEKHEASEPGD